MFRILRVTAVIGAIAFLSPARQDDHALVPQLAATGSAGLDSLGRLLTASWSGPGNVASLLDAEALRDPLVRVVLRRTFDPATTSSIAVPDRAGAAGPHRGADIAAAGR